MVLSLTWQSRAASIMFTYSTVFRSPSCSSSFLSLPPLRCLDTVKAHESRSGDGPCLACALSDLVICLTQGSLELLLKLVIFSFQFFDATIFCKDDEITAGIRFARRTCYTLVHHLLHTLLPQCFDALP